LAITIACLLTPLGASWAATPGHHPISRQDAPASARPQGSASPLGFWLSTAGVAVVLAAFGAVSLGAKKLRPGADSGPLKVVGRASLSSRHTVYLLRAGDRVLIVGAGNQGPPTLLGELSGADVAATSARPHVVPGRDRRIGEPA
jgi:flagellar biogenesis protein FliO